MATLSIAVGALLHWCPAVLAQETTGAVFGVVRSQDGLSLPGATVTIENPATGLRRLAATGSGGQYRFLALPPATYTLEIALDGFRTHRQSLAVALGATITLETELILGSFTDTVQVTAEAAPPIDLTSTVVGMTVDVGELSEKVPVQREVTQVALLAPGTTPGDPRFDEETPGQQLASIGGASVAENLYVVNGLNVTNFRDMLGATKVPFDFIEEVQVKTGGYEAEYGRSTGGVINMVTRSGSNTLHGAANVYFQPEDLQSTEPDTGFTPNNRQHREVLEGNLSLGGPVLSDRLFYFLFASYEDTERMS